MPGAFEVWRMKPSVRALRRLFSLVVAL